MIREQYDIIIIGAGPTGLVLANLLGPFHHKILLAESEKTVFPIPRATHIDEETMRNFQLTGLFSRLQDHIAPFGSMQIKDTDNKVIFEEEIIQPNSEHGYKGSCFFDQPAFEEILRQGLSRYPNITLLAGFEATKTDRTEHQATVTLKDKSTGELSEYASSLLIGCDGGKSIVRSALNIRMHALEPARDWVIVDTLLKHPDDAKLLPDRFEYIFAKERLTIFAYGIGINRRWEFQLKKEEALPDDESIKSWVSKYVDLDKLEITRIAQYAHKSLVAEHWKEKGILLAGDAAHMMPPSAGQGLCSGVRDAVNLAWKLDAVIKNRLAYKLLDTYELERKEHLYHILKRTLFFSHTLNADNRFQYFLRNLKIKTIQRVSPLKNYLRIRYNIPPAIREGFFHKSKLSGQHFPQYVTGNSVLSDDAIGYHFAFIASPACFDTTTIHAIKAKNITMLHEIINIHETPFIKWLQTNDIDFAIIRPDKLIFGTGKKNDLKSVLDALN